MVKCNESLLSPREKRSIVRGVNKKYSDKNLTDEDMSHLIDEAMVTALKQRRPRSVYSALQTKPYRRRAPGRVVRETELECADDFSPLVESGRLESFLETEEEHCSAFEVETSSESNSATSERDDSEKDEVTSEGKLSTSGTGSSYDGCSEKESPDDNAQVEDTSSEDTSVECVQESDSDSYDDLDDDASIIGVVRRFCCGRRH
jgi:hypothetical protein